MFDKVNPMEIRDRFREIETKYVGEDAVKNYQCQICGMNTEDRDWLITRVRQLTEALEEIYRSAGHKTPCRGSDLTFCEAGCEFSEIARKALEEL